MKSRIINRCPIKIDIGAVYNMKPKDAKLNHGLNFKAEEHELVFDIDISDYDDVRNCCRESQMCQNCWPFMRLGAKILHHILTRDFGFEHLLFVYSGRRGFHCWVCDKRARMLSSKARSAIASYLSLIEGGQSMVKRVTFDPKNNLHPMIEASVKIIDTEFEDLMLVKQDFLKTEHLMQTLVDLCLDTTMQEKFRELKLQRLPTTTTWNHVLKASEARNKFKNGKHAHFIKEVKIQHCFPRLDVNVTKGLNHLLKIPFCIHPKTGNVCVPFSIYTVDSFDPTKVPNIRDLEKWNESKTLLPYLKVMKDFLDGLEKSS